MKTIARDINAMPMPSVLRNFIETGVRSSISYFLRDMLNTELESKMHNSECIYEYIMIEIRDFQSQINHSNQ